MINFIGFKLVRVPRGTVSLVAETVVPDTNYNTGESLYAQHPNIKSQVEKCRNDMLSASSTKDFRAQLRNSANIMSNFIYHPILYFTFPRSLFLFILS